MPPRFIKSFLVKVQSIIAPVKTSLSGVFRRLAEKAAELRKRYFSRNAQGKLPLRSIVIASAAALVLLVIAGAALSGRNKARGVTAQATTNTGGIDARRGIIPADELFLPDEPDFVPGVLLGREQRAAWTAEDAALHWQDPLRNGEQEWRDRIEKTIDEIMESVP